MERKATPQEDFWIGEFGDEYIERNRSKELLASNLHFFSAFLEHTKTISHVFEVGCNIGMNLKALQLLAPNIEMSGIEINKKAAEEAATISNVREIIHGSMLDFEPVDRFDLVFTKGVLIHLNPEHLNGVYKKIGRLANKYVLIAEYYNPSPVMVNYRGHTERLFKRDFGAEFQEVCPEFELQTYRFHYKKVGLFPQDDITWFLFERR